ncbi:MAG: fluoride efflux transporter CrcB [Anaerolineales bacterium]|nr:fluoride efflux transporter CrcB [Anaerolineales bacterium]
MEKTLWISLGAVIGANARYWLGGWAAEKWGPAFPYGTLLINLTGSLLLGVFLTWATQRALVDPRYRLLIAVGFCGSYTTFSTYTYESLNLMLTGSWGAGLLNLLGSSGLGLAAVALGIWIGRAL